MPTSKKKIASNKQNAQKSTGPKSKEGKQIVSHNRTIHGLYSKEAVINSPAFKEDPNQYHNLLLSLGTQLSPVGLFEESLVKRIADCLWRSRRAIRAETAQINRQLESVEKLLNLRLSLTEGDDDLTSEDEKRIRDNLIGIRSIPNSTTSYNIIRYEMRLDRQLTRAYKLLIHIQTTRQLEIKKEDAIIPPSFVHTQTASELFNPASGTGAIEMVDEK